MRNFDRVIYKTTNLVNGKIYVGQDAYNNSTYLGSGKILKQAIRKYGKENFTKEILCHCASVEESDQMEKFWINELKSRNSDIGYNIQSGGKGQSDEEYVKRMSDALSGSKNPMFRKTPKYWWIKTHGEEIAEQMWKEFNLRKGDAQRGKPKRKRNPIEQAAVSQNLSRLRKGRANVNGLQRRVVIDGVSYNSMCEAAIKLGKSTSYIRHRCISKSYQNFNFA